MNFNLLADVLQGARLILESLNAGQENPVELIEGWVDGWAGVNPEEFKGQAAFQGGTS